MGSPVKLLLGLGHSDITAPPDPVNIQVLVLVPAEPDFPAGMALESRSGSVRNAGIGLIRLEALVIAVGVSGEEFYRADDVVNVFLSEVRERALERLCVDNVAGLALPDESLRQPGHEFVGNCRLR